MNEIEPLQLDLAEIIKTKNDKVRFLADLDSVSREFFSQEQDMGKVLLKNLSYEQKEKLMQIAKKNNVQVTKGQEFLNFLEKIKKAVQSIPEVTITLAIAPTHEVIAAMSSWFIMNAKKAVIFDIVIDKKIIGGAVIGYNGMYKDFSLSKKLSEKYGQGLTNLLK